MPLIKERRVRHKAEIRAWIQQLKSDTPCADCKQQWPYYVMHFDHLGDDKEKDIGEAVNRGWSRARIQLEMDKCELVCANCHAIRTHQRAQALLAQSVERLVEAEEAGSSILSHGTCPISSVEEHPVHTRKAQGSRP